MIAVQGKPPPTPEPAVLSVKEVFERAYWLFGIARLCLANAVRSSHRAGRLGRRLADSFVDSNFEDMPLAGPLETVSVQGSAARLALTDDGDDGSSWMLAGQLAGGPLFLLLAPSGLTREQVLEIAEQVTDTP